MIVLNLVHYEIDRRARNRLACLKYRTRAEVKARKAEYWREYYAANRVAISLRFREFNSRPEIRERRKIIDATRNRQEYLQRPEVRISNGLRSRVREAIKAKDTSKRSKTMDLIGCDPAHLRLWLTFFFQPGMTWDNYGKVWHIDHIRPCALFDLSSLAQQRECFHYSNMQPLFAKENLRKGAKLEL